MFSDKNNAFGFLNQHLNGDPLNVAEPLRNICNNILSSPEKMLGYQKDYISRITHIKHEIDPKDSRFSDNAWHNNNYYQFFHDIFKVNADFIKKIIVEESGSCSPDEAVRLKFYTQQIIDALSPSNFPWLNPSIAKESIDQQGKNFITGFQNLMVDISKGAITSTKANAFTIGKDIAATKGQVVFRNDMMEIIHYNPLAEQQYNIPLLIMPPWINKYYVLDLSEHNSFVRWLLSNNHDVYIISWFNPEKHYITFEDYLTKGALQAWEFVTKRHKKVNLIGYCIGGTLLAILLAHLKVKKQDKTVASATLMASLIDFSDVGEFASILSEDQLNLFESHVRHQGYVSGLEIYQMFSFMRANDMLWKNAIERYFLGHESPNIDLLFWNSDPTNLPVEMSIYYLRNIYRGNKLIEPNALTLAGTPIDLRSIKTPLYIMAASTDHIVPWKTAYKSTALWPQANFVLASGGHIAGVINPPTSNKTGFFIGCTLDKDPEMWLATAQKHNDSWWNSWREWIQPRAGKLIKSRREKHALYPAPGEYVRKRVM